MFGLPTPFEARLKETTLEKIRAFSEKECHPRIDDFLERVKPEDRFYKWYEGDGGLGASGFMARTKNGVVIRVTCGAWV